jgi:hypothetical protein
MHIRTLSDFVSIQSHKACTASCSLPVIGSVLTRRIIELVSMPAWKHFEVNTNAYKFRMVILYAL